MLLVFFTYLAVGLIAGVLAGLLGVGGGIVIVPMLESASCSNSVNKVKSKSLLLCSKA